MKNRILKSIIVFVKDRIRFIKDSGFPFTSTAYDPKMQERLYKTAPKPVPITGFRFFLKDRRGIIIIVTLIMVIMMTSVALDLHETTLRTYERIKNENNAIQAQLFAKSAMEILLLKLGEHDVGYNLEKIKCNYTDGNPAADNDPFCDDFDWMASSAYQGSNISNSSFTVEVKGRAGEDEKLKTNQCGAPQNKFNGNCYTVPFAGTGTAGVRCNMYDPVFTSEPESSQPGSQYVDNTITGLNDSVYDYEVDQVNYSCNWDKLILGNSDADRIAIPLYYEDYTESGTELGNIVNPFWAPYPEAPSSKANNLILRVRTPCLPCVYDQKEVVFKKNRLCENNQDETVCEDKERYELDDGGASDTKPGVEGNDIVMQWRLYGVEDDGSNNVCGVTAIPNPRSTIINPINKKIEPITASYPGSAIYEFSINYQKIKNYYLLDIKEELGHDICSDPKLKDEEKWKDIDKVLKGLEKPILTLSVSAPLWTKEGRPIPYLEYQILTDYPIANPAMRIDARASADGMGGMKIMYKDVPVSIVDFAIQN